MFVVLPFVETRVKFHLNLTLEGIWCIVLEIYSWYSSIKRIVIAMHSFRFLR